MKILKNNKALTWIIIILIISNLLSLTALTMHLVKNKYKMLPTMMHNKVCHKSHDNHEHFNKNCFLKKLNLNEEQAKQLGALRQEFREDGDTIMKQLSAKREDILTELQKENPDSLILNQLAEEIGLLHTKLKVKTISFYLKMKKDCNLEQQKLLYKLFDKMNTDNHHHGNFHKRDNSTCCKK